MSTKEPRLNIRFKDFTIIDEIEATAHRKGLKKNGWVREAIREKLKNDAKTESAQRERLKGELESRKLIQMMAGPELTDEARAYVKQYLAKVESYDQQKL